jgi:hypothetical protein
VHTIVNANSILLDPYRNNWFLEDIINEVYAAEKVKKGIFILAGCMTSNKSPSDRKALDDAAVIMGYANSMYNTLFKTYTTDERQAGLYTMHTNAGVKEPISRLEPVSIVLDSNGRPIEDFRKLPLGIYGTNVAQMKALYVKKKASKTKKAPKAKVRRPKTKKVASKH